MQLSPRAADKTLAVMVFWHHVGGAAFVNRAFGEACHRFHAVCIVLPSAESPEHQSCPNLIEAYR